MGLWHHNGGMAVSKIRCTVHHDKYVQDYCGVFVLLNVAGFSHISEVTSEGPFY